MRALHRLTSPGSNLRALSKENFIVETLMFIGRILFAAIFVLSGVNHFTKAEAMTGYV